MASSSDANNNEAATVRQTILAHLEAPRLEGTTTGNFNKFLRERELYEKQVAENNLTPGVDMTPVTYRASIDDKMLRMFVKFGWIDKDDIADITETELKECVAKRASREPKDHELGRVETIVSGVRMTDEHVLLEDRVYSLVQNYLHVLESAGMKNLPDTKTHVAIKHILKRLKPVALYNTMADIIEWRKIDQFDRADFKRFVREVAKQAARIDEGGVLQASASSAPTNLIQQRHAEANQAGAKSRRGRTGRQNNAAGAASAGPAPKTQNPTRGAGGQAGSSSEQLPPCLNKKCTGRHYISACPMTSPEERIRLVQDYRQKKKRSRNDDDSPFKKPHGSVKSLGSEQNPNTSLFSASFCSGAVEVVVLADQGSDVNLVPPKVLDELESADSKMETMPIKPPLVLASVVDSAKITCASKFTADAQVRIRHGTTLMLRAVEWMVGDTDMDHIIIGRPLLDRLGCSNEAMLAAAADRNSGVFDTDENESLEDCGEHDEADGNPLREMGKIAALLTDGVYHISCDEEDDDGLEDDVYIDIGENAEGEADAELEKRVAEAVERGISPKGADRLRDILKKHRSVFE